MNAPVDTFSKENIYAVIPKHIIKKIFNDFELNLTQSHHGIYHWARVIQNGRLIAEQNKANINVIIAFAFFHDCQRMNEESDPDHGLRGGTYMLKFENQLNLSKEEISKVFEACEGHTDIIHHHDKDISTCWDADRLDLMRVGIYPNPQKLNNEAAKNAGLISYLSKNAFNQVELGWVNALIADVQSFK